MASAYAEDQGRIVVGIDGSAPSKEALRWAVRQARLTGAAVDAVIAWEFLPTYGWDITPQEVDDLQATADKTLQMAIDEVAGGRSDVPIRPRVVRGHAARVLLDVAEGAELIVVGSRGHGGFAGALLGSVGQYCVQHAACPVVVIRGTR
ncbi:MAG TPA: universal stress protein [Streptosporangiaceae bacterium]